MSIDDITQMCKGKKSVATGEIIPDMNELKANGWKLYKINHNCEETDDKYGIFKIICKEIDMKSLKPNLVVMAGYSIDSFCGSTKIIIDNIKYLLEKYRAVFIICYDAEKFKKIQNIAFDTIDPLKKLYEVLYKEEVTEEFKRTIKYRSFCYQGEIAMYSELAIIIDKILRCPQLNLKNVHLLGKSAGGGLGLHVVGKSDIYTKLFLAVPGGCEFSLPLEKLGDRLNRFRCIVGWNKNDKRDLSGVPSNGNLPYYKIEFDKLKEKYPGFFYAQHMFEPGNGHEINDELVKKIGEDPN
jgi:hypothetical protein